MRPEITFWMKNFLSQQLLEPECLGKYQICTCLFICLFSFTPPLTSVCYCPFSVICYWPGERLTGASTFASRAVHQEFSYSPWLTLLHLVQNTKCAESLTEDVTPRLKVRVIELRWVCFSSSLCKIMSGRFLS